MAPVYSDIAENKPYRPIGASQQGQSNTRQSPLDGSDDNWSRQAEALLALPEKNVRFNSAAGFAALNR